MLDTSYADQAPRAPHDPFLVDDLCFALERLREAIAWLDQSGIEGLEPFDPAHVDEIETLIAQLARMTKATGSDPAGRTPALISQR